MTDIAGGRNPISNAFAHLRRGKFLDAFVTFAPKKDDYPIVLKPYSGQRKALAVRALILLGWASLPFMFFVYGFAFALTAPWLILQFAAPLVVLALVVIWALPDTKYAPTGTLEFLFFAFFIFLFAWPNYVALNLPGMPWITVQRLIGFPMTAVLLLCISLSEEFRAQMRFALSGAPTIWKLLIAFVVLEFICLPIGGMVGKNLIIVHQVSWTVVFFVSCYVFLKPGRAERWAMIAWILAVIVALIGVDEGRHSKVFWAGHLPKFLGTDDNPLVQKILAGAVRDGTNKYRVQSTFTTALGLAEYLALATPFIVHFIAGAYKFWIKVLAVATLPLLVYVLIGTDSRLGMIGFLLSFLLYLVIWAAERWRRVRSDIFGPAITLAYPAIFCAAVASTFFVGRLRAKVWGDGSQDGSNDGRRVQYEKGISALLERPWGYGLGRSAEIAGTVTASGVVTIDTYYIVIALEYGVIGFFIYYAMFILPIFLSGRFTLSGNVWRDRELSLLMPLAVSLANFVVIKSVFSNADNHPMAFMMLGMVMALIARVRGFEAGLAVDQPSPVAQPRGKRRRT